MGEHVQAGDLDIWVERVGEGPEVLLIGGLGDTVESWQLQLDGLADRYRLIAFDNRGAGRTAMPDGPVSVAAMADDAAGVLRALGVPAAHVFEVMEEEEAHQPFQEVPDEWNARVDRFWREVDAEG